MNNNLPKNTRAKKAIKISKRLGVLGTFFVGFILAGVLLLTWVQIEDVEQIKASLDGARPYLTILRLAIISFALVYWENLVRWMGCKSHWSQQHQDQVINKRFHVGITVLLIEVFIIHDGLSYII